MHPRPTFLPSIFSKRFGSPHRPRHLHPALENHRLSSKTPREWIQKLPTVNRTAAVVIHCRCSTKKQPSHRAKKSTSVFSRTSQDNKHNTPHPKPQPYTDQNLTADKTIVLLWSSAKHQPLHQPTATHCRLSSPKVKVSTASP